MKYTFLEKQDVPAFLGEDFEISYTNAYSIIKEAANKIPQNVKHIAIFAENSPEWVCAVYAAWSKGCTLVPIDAGLTVAEFAFILKDSESDYLYTSRACLDKAKEAVEQAGRNIEISILNEMEKPLSSQNGDNFKIECDSADLAIIVYTSGTTSNPKGVMLTFDNLLANIEAVAEEGYFTPKMRGLAMLPFHHILPFMGSLMGVLFVGGSIIFPKSVAPADIGKVLVKHRATMVISVPRFYELIHANVKEKVNRSLLVKTLFAFAKMVGSTKFSRLLFNSVHKRFGGCVKFWVSGGAALDKQAALDLTTLGFCVCEGYGMTECAPMISFPRIGDIKIGACGKSLPGNEVRIVDGEITVRGRSVTSSYYKRPDENEATFKNGWLYTGDLGHIDDDGFIFVTGRRKEIIVLPNGKKLNPIELELQIKEKTKEIEEVGVLIYDDILQAVVRVNDEFWNAQGEEAVKEFVREKAILPYNRLNASYKRIMRFTVSTKEFPRTRIGKLKRFQLASFIESIRTELPNPAELRAEPDTKIYKELKDFMKMQVSLPVTADAHLEMDLALDSLGKISLHSFIKESYSVDMKEEDLEKHPTLRKVAEFVEAETNKTNPAPKTKYLSWGDILKSYSGSAKVSRPYFFHLFTIWASKIFLKYKYKVVAEGLDHIPAKGPVILAGNHQSLCDGFMFAACIKTRRVWGMYFYAKIREMMKSSLMKFIVRHSNIVVVDIHTNVRESLQSLAEILRRNKTVVIFPEGTRTRDGEISEFKQTFAILAKELDVPVVPFVISGAYEGLKTRSSLPEKGTTLTLKILPPTKVDENERYKEFAERIRLTVLEAKNKLEGKKTDKPSE